MLHGKAGKAGGRAIFLDHRCEHVVGAGGDGLVEATQHDSALGRRGARHRREGAPGCGNREVHIIGVAEANLADLFLGRGIEQRRSIVAVRRDESAVDVDRVDGVHGISSFPSFRSEICTVHR